MFYQAMKSKRTKKLDGFIMFKNKYEKTTKLRPFLKTHKPYGKVFSSSIKYHITYSKICKS